MPKNKIAPNNASKEIELKEKVFKWNFEKSVAKIRPKVEKWKTLTLEIAQELYLARENLNGQIGQRKDPLADNYLEFTWADYCEAIGISKRIANDWLKVFIPSERSETGVAYLMTPEEMKAVNAERQKEEADAREARIAKFLKTGKRGEGWTNADDRELNARLAVKRAKEVANLWRDNKLKVEPRRDFFAEIMNHGEDLKKFSLKTPAQNAMQLKVFDSIDSYLHSFDSMNERLTAAYNLSVKLKDIVNYYAELDIQNAEANGEE
ncbi:hypothetical protein [Treponema denticola]|uniref:hypothetical protein n=1 Tax=Treponema denticola TaxID=158 RepID=UPI0011C89C5A|nr:hypothetical protein [Treponema denticola]